MSSPITFGGFNQNDFGMILNAVMEQEREPVKALETQQAALRARDDSYTQLATKLASLESAAGALSDIGDLVGRRASSTDSSSLGVAASAGALPGTYEVVVEALARAQVTASTASFGASDIVATSGVLTIGGVGVEVTSGLTLAELASTINATANITVEASIVTVGADQYRLVLTGKNTGTAGAFDIASTLSGGAQTISFGASAVAATDASVRVNEITIVSGSNTVENAIPGATLTLLEEDPAVSLTVTVSRDWEDLKSRVDKFVTAYNDLVTFAEQQSIDASAGRSSSLARESVFRGVRAALRDVLMREYGTGDYNSLAKLGIELDRTGRLSFKRTTFDDAIDKGASEIERLFAGEGSTSGLFDDVASAIKDYTRAGGVLSDTQTRLDEQVSRIGQRIADLEARLAVRRAALQKEYMAADMAMSRMSSQMSSLSAFGNEYRLF